MTTCHQCGKEIPEGAQFCPSCGAAVRAPEPQQPTPTPARIEQVGARPPAVTRDAMNMAMLCHLSAFAGFVFPLGNILGPLLVWLLRRYDSPFIDFHGKEAVNFQISMTIYLIISAILILVLIGIVLLIAFGLFAIITTIVAAVRAADGIEFRYPLSIRFIR